MAGTPLFAVRYTLTAGAHMKRKELVLSESANCCRTDSLAQFMDNKGNLRKDIPGARKRVALTIDGVKTPITVVPVRFPVLPVAAFADVVTGSLYDAGGRCLTGQITLV